MSVELRLTSDIIYDISVVIVSYNTREMTMACVQSILNHNNEHNIQIIVVDNGSSDGSANALREKFDGIMVIDSPRNGGFSYGNNIGFEQAKGRYILVLNPDTEIFANTLKKCSDYMDAHQNIGVIGPRVLLANGQQQSSMIRFFSLKQLIGSIFLPGSLMRRTTVLGDPRYAALSSNDKHFVDSISGCYMFIRRQILENVGGFDTRFFMYGEETEWCYRIRKAGYDIAYNPDIEILHHGAASTGHESEWKSVEMARGHILFLRFTRGKNVARVAVFLMLCRDILRSIFHLGKTIINGFKPTIYAKSCWARLKFILASIFHLPEGQKITLPNPDNMHNSAIKKQKR